MLALRYLYVLALVTWLGGMIVLGVLVAPTTFQVLEMVRGAEGRELAGAVFGAIIGRFHYVAYGSGAVLLLSLAAIAVLGPRPKQYAVRSAIIAAMLGISLYSGLIVLSTINDIQRNAGGSMSRLPADDARRIRFDELHLLSTRLMMLNMAGAMILLYWETRE